jgi:hypothetical protein
MLLEKSYKIDDVCTMKMVTGEEVIAKIADIKGDTLTITKPLVLQIGVDNNNQPVLQMLPSFMFSGSRDARITIDMRHIIAIVPSDDNARSNYISSTTGLAVPGAKQGLVR